MAPQPLRKWSFSSHSSACTFQLMNLTNVKCIFWRLKHPADLNTLQPMGSGSKEWPNWFQLRNTNCRLIFNLVGEQIRDTIPSLTEEMTTQWDVSLTSEWAESVNRVPVWRTGEEQKRGDSANAKQNTLHNSWDRTEHIMVHNGPSAVPAVVQWQ